MEKSQLENLLSVVTAIVSLVWEVMVVFFYCGLFSFHSHCLPMLFGAGLLAI